MLDVLRSKSRSVLTYVLFGIIIIVFVVSFGPGSQGCQVQGLSATSAVEVDGYVVTPADYEQHYAQLVRTYQSRVGGTFTRELAEQLGLRNVAMNQLIDRRLVINEAQRRGLRVTPDEVNRVVWSIPAFQTNGKFDIELYRRTVRQAYGSEPRFEEQLTDDLLYQKMLALLREGTQVSEEEVKAAWLADADRADLVYVRFPLAAARKEVKVTDAEVAAFVKADAARIEQAYKADAARWERKKRVRARHVLVKVPEGAPAAQDEAARKRIEAAAERVKKGEPFATVARDVTEDASTKDKGGDLGFFGAGVMAKPFEDAAFALKPGEVSAPVRTRFGWHLIQAEAVEEARTVPLAEARPVIAREMLETEAAQRLADRRAREALAQLKGGKKLADLFPATPPAPGKKGGATLGGEPLLSRDTGPFSPSAGAPIPGLGEVPALVAAAAAGSTGQVLPDVYATAGGPVVAQVKARVRPDPAQFASQHDAIAERLRSRRQSELETAWLKGLRDGAKVKINDAVLRTAAPEQG
jgi:peptidyl-prolyl cis-trans isomerase D